MSLQEPCACGGLIVAAASWTVMDAVSRHNATPIHRAWRRRRELVEANARYRERMRREVAEVRLLRALEREVAA